MLRTVLVLAVAAVLSIACADARPAPTAVARVATPAAQAVTGATAAPTKPPGVKSAAEAAEELKQTRLAYEAAQKAFAAGDRARALELMNGAYLDHFERVEPWMDASLTKEYREQVESAISRDLRRKLRDNTGTDVELATQFPRALQALSEAEAKVGTVR